ncbi:hypothetical protein EI94DRAFT_869539 [Lactarius quietus]|nr:hypothetical protein EI94DRAFT_869539 [Lactarius quietus]
MCTRHHIWPKILLVPTRLSRWGWRALVLHIGIRLGAYYDTIKLTYTLPRSVVIAGGRHSLSFVCRRTNCPTWPLTVHARQFRCDYPRRLVGLGSRSGSPTFSYPTASPFYQNDCQESPAREAQSVALAWIFPKRTNLCDYRAWELRTFPWECVRKMPVSVRVCSSDVYARRVNWSTDLRRRIAKLFKNHRSIFSSIDRPLSPQIDV